MDNVKRQTISCVWHRHQFINFAMQQNFVPIIRQISLHNGSEQELRQVTVQVKADPDFAPAWARTLDLVPAGMMVDLGAIPLQISGSFLAQLTERLTGTLTLTVSNGEQTLYEEVSPVTLLAYDEWSGTSIMPELTAAFVMPNHPSVIKVIGEAAPLLDKWTGSSAFDSYQSQNPNRIRQQAAAIFAAIQAHKPVYCVAPASFEITGQRVRLPDAIVTNRMGNCLDLSLLYAACLEAVGLHPLVVFKHGHAFPGVWLIEDTFSEAVQDDVTLLTKRLAAGVHEISVVEATLMCEGSSSSYEEAEQHALKHLRNPDEFEIFIDINRARSSAIRPVPIRVLTTDGWQVQERKDTAAVHASAPQEVVVHAKPQPVDALTVTKQKQWERKLLDLTLRNTLLNFRLTKSALPLMNGSLSELEDSLAEGTEFQLLSKPLDWEQSARDADMFQTISHENPLSVLIQQEFRNKRLRANAADRELELKTVHLYRSAKASLEENGANTLYLALGLLRWFESQASEQPRYAPVVLIPVELIRRTTRAGFVLRMRDEEPQINITLLEMLRQDFGIQISGLDPLPRDEKGIDLSGIFTTIRHVVMSLPRWDIIESAILGLFSFSRFVMWNDIRSRSDDLARNNVVASLMSGKLVWEPGSTFPDSATLDERFAPDGLLLPISADSSQITAVCAANEAKSFVLHGPPGTGKSQTITNMIASALGSGKTVLFVAEKMAALSVVQNRLEQIGLGTFCLELHSNKSTKKAVLEQLRLSLEAAKTSSPEQWRRQAERLAASRSELNDYVSSLHRQYGFGASLSEAIARYGEVRSAPVIAAFDVSSLGEATQEQFVERQDRMNELRVAAEATGHPGNHVWAESALTEYSPTVRLQAEESLQHYANKLKELKDAYTSMKSMLDNLVTHPTREELETVAALAELLITMPDVMPAALLRVEDVALAQERVAGVIRHGRQRDLHRTAVLKLLKPESLSYDAPNALSEWRTAELQWFLPKTLKQGRIFKLIHAMATDGAALQKKDIPSVLNEIIGYQAELSAVKQREAEVSHWLEPLWKGGEAHWNAAEAANDWIGKLGTVMLQLYRDRVQARAGRERIALLTDSGTAIFREKHAPTIAAYIDAYRQLLEAQVRLEGLLKLDFAALDQRKTEHSWLSSREQHAQACLQALDSLRDWSTWRQVRERALHVGLSAFVDAYEGGALAHADAKPAFDRAWWKAVVDFILEADKKLASFSGKLFEDKIKGFQELIGQFELLTRQEIAARLAAQVPPILNQASSSSEAGILLRAIRSGGRGMSLRKLFEQIPNLLNRLCPCMLMSPMSVAQFIDPKYAPFDLVVFDEASQMPTSEAVGAMARGRNVIVVGDPKQLPPTSFFSNTVDEQADDSAVTEDLESILDDCLALGMPQEHLLWHYRSRHESLIAFSNRHFYDNKLLTFPSPFERKSSVRWHHVDGFYDRGKTKQNRAEAEHTVNEIARRLRNPELAQRSIGVVTFNSIQQSLIEDLLDEAFRKDAALEQAAARLYEPIFVKNLENVQGDERDVILFSIGYGPDATGKVVLNFGPLNREGGWRRLNVAISRARHEMHVFSTLKAEHLDMSRTNAHGVSVLRAFLEYAEKGQSALIVPADQLSEARLGVEAQIARALEQEGFHVDVQVGASGYRIDLAVSDPEQPNRYLLGVLCDGDSYKTGKTARDREVLREQVLRQLGWHIHRVWSMDWLDNPAREIERIKEALRIAQATAAEQALANAATVQESCDATPLPFANQPATSEHVQQELPGVKQAAVSTIASVSPVPASQMAYSTATLSQINQPADMFYASGNGKLIVEQLKQTIDEEGPISRTLLIKRVLNAWAISRSGAKIERHLSGLLQTLGETKTVWDGLEYYWPNGIEPGDYEKFRIAATDLERRNADELPPEEIANAIKDVLFNQVSLPVEDLIRETVKLLGYARVGASLDKAVRNGLLEAIRRGYAKEDNGRILYHRP